MTINKYSQAINYFNKIKYAQSQQEPDWVAKFKSDKKTYVINGNNITGFGFRKFKGDINFTREIASSNARNALIAGAAEIKKINSDKISATIQGAPAEYYFDKTSDGLFIYAKVSADLSKINFE